jgi:DNA (cytosine-5)-methyltransferase 1
VDLSTFRILSICSGVGGIELGFKLSESTSRTVCYVEIEAFACEILARRMEEKRLDAAPIWTNLKTFDGKPWRGKVDCITGGYPCQPFSVAGKKLGKDDPRHGKVPQIQHTFSLLKLIKKAHLKLVLMR